MLSGTISMPWSGSWVAHVEASEALPDSGVLTDGAASLVGACVVNGLRQSRGAARIVGGAGKLSERCGAAHYQATTALQVARAIASSVGETVAPGATAADSAALQAYSVASLPADAALSDLGVWRVSDAGSIQLLATGETGNEAVGVEIDSVPELGAVILGADGLTIRPGDTYNGQIVRRVVYDLGRALTAMVYL